MNRACEFRLNLPSNFFICVCVCSGGVWPFWTWNHQEAAAIHRSWTGTAKTSSEAPFNMLHSGAAYKRGEHLLAMTSLKMLEWPTFLRTRSLIPFSCYASPLPEISRKFVCGMIASVRALLGHRRDHHRDWADHVTAWNLHGQWEGDLVNSFWREAEFSSACCEEQEGRGKAPADSEDT